MDWLQKNYDRVILLAVSLITIAISLVLIMKSFSYPKNFEMPEVEAKDVLPESREADVSVAIETLKKGSIIKGPTIDGKEPRLFMTFPIVEKDGEAFDMSEPEPRLREPVDNTWLVENDLNFLDKSVLENDKDGDGFSNLEEWEAQTEPDDDKSAPPVYRKLFFVKDDPENYVMSFQARPDEKKFQIARYEPLPAQSQFVAAGEKFFKDDSRFRLESYEKKELVEPSGLKRDVSEITVTDLQSSEKLTLVFRQRFNRPTNFAILVFTLGGETEFRVKEGGEFAIPGRPSERYKLIEIGDNQVKIATLPGPGQAAEEIIVKKKP